MNHWKLGFHLLNGALTVGILAGSLVLVADNIKKNERINQLEHQLIYSGKKSFPIYYD